MSNLPPSSQRTVNLVFSFVKAKYGIRLLTKKLLREICKTEKITLIDIFPFFGLGCYTRYKGDKYILLDNAMPPEQYIEVAGHELGHHFLAHLDLTKHTSFGFHSSTGYYKDLSKFKRQVIEMEADLFSSLLRGEKQ